MDLVCAGARAAIAFVAMTHPRMSATAIAILLSVPAPHSRVTAQGEAPPAMYSRAAAFDVARNRLVVFGGSNRGSYSDETWAWASGRWTRVSTSGPSARNGAVMVYDSRRNRLVLFGGDTRDRVFADTWELDDATWRKVSETGPPARSLQSMTFDEGRGRVVMFGGMGQSASAAPTVRDDTWEWDGTNWAKGPGGGPGPRFLAALAYDVRVGRTVLFGGSSAMPPGAADPRGETWEWDGRAWTRIEGSTPPARDHASMTFDAARSRLLLFGGDAGQSGSLGDVWERVGPTWNRVVIPNGPSARAGHHLVFDPAAKRVLLFGGFGSAGPTSELWSFDGTTWRHL